MAAGLSGSTRHRHPADEVGLRVGILAAQDGVDLDDFALPVQRLQVVRHGHQVGFGRKLVGGVAPVAVGEEPELAACDECLPVRALTPAK